MGAFFADYCARRKPGEGFHPETLFLPKIVITV